MCVSFSMESLTSPAVNTTRLIPYYIRKIQDYDCQLFTFYFNGILNVSIIVFGIISNICTVITLWNERKSNGTSFLLVFLAFVDSLVLLSGSIVTFIPA